MTVGGLSRRVGRQGSRVLIRPARGAPSRQGSLFRVRLINFLCVVVMEFRRERLVKAGVRARVHHFIALRIGECKDHHLVLFRREAIFERRLQVSDHQLRSFISNSRSEEGVRIFVDSPFRPIERLFTIILNFTRMLRVINRGFVMRYYVAIFGLAPLFLLNCFLLPRRIRYDHA